MERNNKGNRKCGQNQEKNTESYYKDSRISSPATQKDNLNSITRTLINHDGLPKICTRQTHNSQEKRFPKPPPRWQPKDQAESSKSPTDKYQSSKCLPHQCPSLSIKLLSRVPSYLETPYTPHPRHAHHLPPLSSMYAKDRCRADQRGAEGDRLLYKNNRFDLESSLERSDDHSERSDRTTLPLKDSKKLLQKDFLEDKHSSPLVKSAREHCKQMHERIKAKYTALNEQATDSGSLGETRKTLISGKSAGDLRSVVRSQIQVQELIDRSVRKLNRSASKRLDLVSSLSELTINSLKQDLDFKLDKLENNPTKNARPGNLMLSVSAEEMVSTKLIAPVVRKVQRMYLGTLKEEMSIIEDLERLPCQVSSVFQSADEQKQHTM